MCGIAGFVETELDGDGWQGRLTAMEQALTHRGPDDRGIWFSPSLGVGLAHRRLSIVDLSPRGHQPMASADGRFLLAYNGEIYNFPILRDELAGRGHTFQGTSDTEIALAAFLEWGLEGALERFNGMFAFALVDRREARLHLVRDRIGEKPLYYGRVGSAFAFASELKALRALPGFDHEVDRAALTLLLRHAYIPSPHSIYRGISKLRPGEMLTLPLRAAPRAPWTAVRTEMYWDAARVVEEALKNPLELSDDEAVERLHDELSRSVKSRMLADVPVGAFLSGGIDSSLVVALMQELHSQPVRTFTIGFEEERFDESPFAREVADHLGTAHTKLDVSGADALGVVPRLPVLFDEPFADASQIPTYLVSHLARRDVTVCLTGDGGDELFYGYSRYPITRQLWGNIRRLPRPARAGLSRVLRAAPMGLLEGAARWGGPLIRRWGPPVHDPADKLKKVAEVLGVRSGQELYRRVVSLWNEADGVVLGAEEPATVLTRPSVPQAVRGGADGSLEETMMYLDLVSYLPGDILAKVDRTAMAVSLETRLPLLDPEIVELAWRLPMRFKERGGEGKWLLRRLLDRYVPRERVERPKQGFAVPLAEWLRGPLREWAEDLLAEDRLRRQGYFDVERVRERWVEHRSGARDWKSHLWALLVFQQWLEAEGSSRAEEPPAEAWREAEATAEAGAAETTLESAAV